LAPRPPSSPLFPYTTLFRSVLMARANGPEPAPSQQGQPAQPGSQPGLQSVPQVQTDQPEDNAADVPPEVPQPEEEQPEQPDQARSEEHTSELQSLAYLVCRL